jgi:hypothetical protein
MLAISEIAQVARRPESGADQVTVNDPDEVAVEVGGMRVLFRVDRLGDPRWTFEVTDDGQAVAAGVVAGAGTITETVLAARQLAGLPPPTVAPQPSKLSFGGEA